jgi:hypothetical protein
MDAKDVRTSSVDLRLDMLLSGVQPDAMVRGRGRADVLRSSAWARTRRESEKAQLRDALTWAREVSLPRHTSVCHSPVSKP